MNKQNNLDMKEFTILLKEIAPGLKNEEVLECFKRFDTDKNGQISFNEFKLALLSGMANK